MRWAPWAISDSHLLTSDALFVISEEATGQYALASDASVVRPRSQLLAHIAALAEVDC